MPTQSLDTKSHHAGSLIRVLQLFSLPIDALRVVRTARLASSIAIDKTRLSFVSEVVNYEGSTHGSSELAPLAAEFDPLGFSTFQFRSKTQISSASGPTPFVLRSGWALQQFVKPTGQRQILGIMLPGEAYLRYSRFAMFAATDCVVDIPARSGWDRFCATNAPVTGSVDDFETVQLWRLAFGGTTSNQRIAFFLCELMRRLAPASTDNMPVRLGIPLEQQDIADLCCISKGQVGRTLQDLEGLKLIDRCFKGVVILDLRKLKRLAEI